MDRIKLNLKSIEIRSFLKFWVFFFLLSFVRTIWTDNFRNPQYRDWLETYDGKFNQLKYTEVAYRGNRKANSGKEKLASADLGGMAHGFLGNFHYAVGLDRVHGLDQSNLLAQTAPGNFIDVDARFNTRGESFTFSKRFFRLENYNIHMGLSYRTSDANISATAIGNPPRLTMPDGEQVNTFVGTQNNNMYNLDLTFSRLWTANSRYSITALGGIRLSDFGVKVRYDGNTLSPVINNNNLATAIRDYHFRNIGIGPFIGFQAQTPITRSVYFAISAKQILLPSRGTARLSRLNQNDNGQTIINETTNEERSSTFPITEIVADINFFWDHSTRINLGYAYSHWNFYEIQGFGRSNFQDLSFSGPRLSLNYHF
ncbi:MAG: hypothetical protein VX619_04275 [bacterium]|nr:hypothetical protein [bacterium]